MSQLLVLTLEVSDDAQRQPTVQEIFAQLSDMVDLAAEGGPAVWKLVSISKNSPLRLVAEAASPEPGVLLDAMAVARQLESFTSGIRDIGRGRLPPRWDSGKPKKLVKQILQRTVRSIPRIRVSVEEPNAKSKPVTFDVSITPAISELLVRLDETATSLDLGSVKSQIGQIVGRFVEVKTYYGHPAIVVKERLSSDEVLCVITEGDREKIAQTADFDDVWQERRVLVTGRIEYDEKRQISKINATAVSLLDDRDVPDQDLHQPGFTGGLTPEEYLTRLREGTLG